MEFRLSYPPSHTDLPADDAELLALLLGRPYCQERLSAAEAEENFLACAAWLKAVNSGLPMVLNALLPHYAAVAQQQQGDGPREPVLSADVDTFEELLHVLREVATAHRKYPDAGHFGLSIDHFTRKNPYYAFSQKAEAREGGPDLSYEGCFSS